MSFPLSPTLERHFLDPTYRGFEIFGGVEKVTLNSNVEFLSMGSLSEARSVQLAWIFQEGIFQTVRFKAFGDPYLIGCFSWLCFYLEGNSWESLSRISLPQIAQYLEIPQSKLSCLMVMDDVIQHLLLKLKR